MTAWRVGDLCVERGAPLSMNILRVIDLDPRARGGGYDTPWFDGRVEVEVGHFTSGRVGGFTAIHRGRFPLCADLDRYTPLGPYEGRPQAFQALLEAAERLPGGVLHGKD